MEIMSHFQNVHSKSDDLQSLIKPGFHEGEAFNKNDYVETCVIEIPNWAMNAFSPKTFFHWTFVPPVNPS